MPKPRRGIDEAETFHPSWRRYLLFEENQK
jgi:hypothetical protein